MDTERLVKEGKGWAGETGNRDLRNGSRVSVEAGHVLAGGCW